MGNRLHSLRSCPDILDELKNLDSKAKPNAFLVYFSEWQINGNLAVEKEIRGSARNSKSVKLMVRPSTETNSFYPKRQTLCSSEIGKDTIHYSKYFRIL
jgi:hypothetical protein